MMTLAGCLIIGPLGDRYSRHWVTAGLMGMQLAGLGVLAVAPTSAGALIYVALFGAGSGTLTIMRAALLAERYGPAHYGSISGVLSLALIPTAEAVGTHRRAIGTRLCRPAASSTPLLSGTAMGGSIARWPGSLPFLLLPYRAACCSIIPQTQASVRIVLLASSRKASRSC